MPKSVGRPTEFRHPQTTSVIFEADELEAFKQVAWKQGKSMGEFIREWAKEFVKAHQDNDQTGITKWIDDPQYWAWPTLGDNPEPIQLSGASMPELKLLRARAQNWVYQAEKELTKRQE